MKQKTTANQNFIFVLISIFIIILAYFVVCIVRFFQKPASTVLIKKGELINYEEVVGYIIRDEEIVDTSHYDGMIKSVTDDATRVSKGSPIITYVSKSEEQIMDKIAKLDEKIDKAVESQQTIFTSDVKSLESEIESYIYTNIKENMSISSIKEYKKILNSKIEKKAKIVGELSPAGSEVKSLINQRTEYEKELNNSEKVLISPSAGLVSYRVDNFENVLTYNSISSLTTNALKNLKTTLDAEIPINQRNVKIVNNFECYIAVSMNSPEARSVKLNDNIYLRFKNTGNKLIPATIEYISNESENVLLVLKIKSNVEDLTRYRKIGMDVVWWSSTGLKVNKSAITYTNITIDNSVSGDVENLSGDSIIKQVELPMITVKKAYNTEDVWVKILKETKDFVIIDNYTDEELINLGLSESQIQNRSTIKMYDEALIVE